MEGLAHISKELLSKLEDYQVSSKKLQIRNFLYPLIEHIYEHENSSQLATLSEKSLYSHAPTIHIIDAVLIDELTQVYNRKYLVDSLQYFFQDFKRTKKPFSISMVDIDFFKKVNDTHGHVMGDQVLKTFAQYLRQNLRTLDIICRYGEEEFVIIFPKTTNIDVRKRLNQVNEGFSKIEFTHNNSWFSVTFSAGVFTVDDASITVEDTLKEADRSLYEAKSLGRARVECLQMSSNIHKKRIINISVIDDDIIIRSLLAQILESITLANCEFNIMTFENGPSFLNSAHADDEVNHFLILDGIMPEMDGLEVLQMIKQGENANKYKVLMLTGRNSKREVERALRLGVMIMLQSRFT